MEIRLNKMKLSNFMRYTFKFETIQPFYMATGSGKCKKKKPTNHNYFNISNVSECLHLVRNSGLKYTQVK